MYARLATRAVGRRGFHTTRAQFSSPYHYPDGPYSNIPFNPRSKWFAFGFWGFCATGFGLPFATSSKSSKCLSRLLGAFSGVRRCGWVANLWIPSLANLQA